MPRRSRRSASGPRIRPEDLRSSLENNHGFPDRLPMSLRIHAQGRRVALLAFPRPRSMAMHNPRFPRIHPLALSLLLACGAGASLPAMAGITRILEASETRPQDNRGATPDTQNKRTPPHAQGPTAHTTP